MGWWITRGPMICRVRRRLGRGLSGWGPGLPLTVTKTERDTIGGTALFKVVTGGPVKWFWMKFDWTVTVMAGRYIFHLLHYYEKPVGPGVSNEFSKIEYRWGDYRAGH